MIRVRIFLELIGGIPHPPLQGHRFTIVQHSIGIVLDLSRTNYGKISFASHYTARIDAGRIIFSTLFGSRSITTS